MPAQKQIASGGSPNDNSNIVSINTISLINAQGKKVTTTLSPLWLYSLNEDFSIKATVGAKLGESLTLINLTGSKDLDTQGIINISDETSETLKAYRTFLSQWKAYKENTNTEQANDLEKKLRESANEFINKWQKTIDFGKAETVIFELDDIFLSNEENPIAHTMIQHLFGIRIPEVLLIPTLSVSTFPLMMRLLNLKSSKKLPDLASQAAQDQKADQATTLALGNIPALKNPLFRELLTSSSQAHQRLVSQAKIKLNALTLLSRIKWIIPEENTNSITINMLTATGELLQIVWPQELFKQALQQQEPEEKLQFLLNHATYKYPPLQEESQAEALNHRKQTYAFLYALTTYRNDVECEFKILYEKLNSLIKSNPLQTDKLSKLLQVFRGYWNSANTELREQLLKTSTLTEPQLIGIVKSATQLIKDAAATKIQSIARSKTAQKELSEMQEKQNQAATRIQSLIRRQRAQKSVEEMRAEAEKKAISDNIADAWQRLLEVKNNKDITAGVLQNALTDFQKAIKNVNLSNFCVAAPVPQNQERMLTKKIAKNAIRRATKKLNKLRDSEAKEKLKIETKAATIIQTSFRGKAARDEAAKVKAELEATAKAETEAKAKAETEDKAATKIQAFLRGKLVKEKVASWKKNKAVVDKILEVTTEENLKRLIKSDVVKLFNEYKKVVGDDPSQETLEQLAIFPIDKELKMHMGFMKSLDSLVDALGSMEENNKKEASAEQAPQATNTPLVETSIALGATDDHSEGPENLITLPPRNTEDTTETKEASAEQAPQATNTPLVETSIALGATDDHSEGPENLITLPPRDTEDTTETKEASAEQAPQATDTLLVETSIALGATDDHSKNLENSITLPPRDKEDTPEAKVTTQNIEDKQAIEEDKKEIKAAYDELHMATMNPTITKEKLRKSLRRYVIAIPDASKEYIEGLDMTVTFLDTKEPIFITEAFTKEKDAKIRVMANDKLTELQERELQSNDNSSAHTREENSNESDPKKDTLVATLQLTYKTALSARNSTNLTAYLEARQALEKHLCENGGERNDSYDPRHNWEWKKAALIAASIKPGDDMMLENPPKKPTLENLRENEQAEAEAAAKQAQTLTTPHQVKPKTLSPLQHGARAMWITATLFFASSGLAFVPATISMLPPLSMSLSQAFAASHILAPVAVALFAATIIALTVGACLDSKQHNSLLFKPGLFATCCNKKTPSPQESPETNNISAV